MSALGLFSYFLSKTGSSFFLILFLAFLGIFFYGCKDVLSFTREFFEDSEGFPGEVIVIPNESLWVEIFAAQELNDHLKEMTGRMPLVVFEKDIPKQANWLFFLGGTERARLAGFSTDGFGPNRARIIVKDNEVIIAGGDEEGDPLNDRTWVGTLFGVYSFLEKECGVRWLWPGSLGAFVPRKEIFDFVSGERDYSPPFQQSMYRICSLTDGGHLMEDAKFFYRAQRVWLRRHRFGRTVDFGYGHAFYEYWDRFGVTFPEYFNLLPDGTRRPDPLYEEGKPVRVSMDVTSLAFRKQVIKDWYESRTTRRSWINAVENDAPGKCVDEDCLAWDSGEPLRIRGEVMSRVVSEAVSVEKARRAYLNKDVSWYRFLGSLSDRYARFYLALLEEGRKVDPAVKVVGGGYANRREPPVEVRLNKDVVVLVTPAVMFPWTKEKRDDFFKQWEGWQESGASLVLRPNYCLDGHVFPVFYAHYLAEAFRFSAQRGLVATDFDSLTGQWATQGPNSYLLARLHNDVSLSAEVILEEYYKAFGNARSGVAAYFAFWQKVSDRVTQEEYDGDWLHFLTSATKIFSPDVMSKAEELLREAERLAMGERLSEQRVAFLRLGFSHVQLCLKVERAYRMALDSGDWDNFDKVLAALHDFRVMHQGTFFSNHWFLSYLEKEAWKERNAD